MLVSASTSRLHTAYSAPTLSRVTVRKKFKAHEMHTFRNDADVGRGSCSVHHSRGGSDCALDPVGVHFVQQLEHFFKRAARRRAALLLAHQKAGHTLQDSIVLFAFPKAIHHAFQRGCRGQTPGSRSRLRRWTTCIRRTPLV